MPAADTRFSTYSRCTSAPAATASPSDSRAATEPAARWPQTRDDAHAVSRATQGPWSPSRKLARPAATQRTTPSGSGAYVTGLQVGSSSRHDAAAAPAKTPTAVPASAPRLCTQAARAP